MTRPSSALKNDQTEFDSTPPNGTPGRLFELEDASSVGGDVDATETKGSEASTGASKDTEGTTEELEVPASDKLPASANKKPPASAPDIEPQKKWGRKRSSEKSASVLSRVKKRIAVRARRTLDVLSIFYGRARSATPRVDADEIEMTWVEALRDTAVRCTVSIRGMHMRAMIVLILLAAGFCATSGAPVVGVSVSLPVWPLQAVSVGSIWVGLTVPWAREHSFGKLFRDGAFENTDESAGEFIDVMVPSLLLIVLGGACYAFSAALLGAGDGSWGLLKVMTFLFVSAVATATAAHETASISRSACSNRTVS